MLNIRAFHIKVLAFFLILLSGRAGHAQRPFGNEWINFSQPYYKIKIAKDGIYRLDQNALSSAGISIATLNPQKLQLFHRGEQVPVYIEGESDGAFDAADYIEFRGQRNDGAFDALLFSDPDDITHTDFSTYTDTSAYFLTVSEQGPYRRTDHVTTTSGAGAITSIIGSKAKYFHTIYQDGSPVIYDNAGRGIPEYTSGEGWMSSFYNTSDNTKPKLKIDTFLLDDALPTSSFVPRLEIKVISQNFNKNANPDHRFQVDVASSSAAKHTIFDTTYESYQVIRRTLPLTIDDIQGPTYVYIIPINVISASFSTEAVAYEKITYEKELNAGSQLNTVFEFGPRSGGGNITFGFKVPVSFGTPGVLLYDLTGGHRSQGFYDNGMLYFTIAAPGILSKYILVKEGDFNAAAPAAVTFRKIDPGQNYNFLMVAHPKLLNAAQQYAAYKDTRKISGSENFKTILVTVDELYDEFSYGVKHPMAIQNFAAYMYKSAPAAPQHLFLFGKGVPINLARTQYNNDLVPTIGMPATDLLYISGIQSGFTGLASVQPAMGVGRLPVRTEADALAYLQKLKEYDDSPAELWHKDAIHVGGGQDIFVQTFAAAVLNANAKIFEGKSVGGNVRSFLAKSSDELNKDLRGSIQKEIEGGAGLLTYYGHAAGTVLGVEIADFNTLSNKGKYPVMYLNGCNVGDPSIFGGTPIAENYLVKPDKGAIAWISHSNTALSNTLQDQMRNFYKNMSDSLYGGSIGQIWAKSITQLKVPKNLSSMERHGAFAWTIQGDPSIKFHFQDLPDYAVYDKEISISPIDVIASSDVFYLKIPINNLGRASDALPGICVRQHLPNGQVWEHEQIFVDQGVYYKDTVELAIHPNGRPIQGLNRFEITVNCDESIEETDKSNNKAELLFYIQGTGARALFPANYSIVNTDTTTLVSQSRDLFNTTTETFFEIDTVQTFNSPFKKSSGLIKGGNITTWNAQLLTEDSVVYYWRSRLNLPADSGGDWDVRSFTYLKGRGPGWSQSRWPQFKGISGNGVVIDTVAGRFDFLKSYSSLGVKMTTFGLAQLGINREGEVITPCWLGSSTLAVVEIDRTTLKTAITRTITSSQQASCIGRVVYYYWFNMLDPADRQNFVKYIDTVPNGNYLAITTRYDRQQYKDWEPEVIAAFEKVGSKKVHELDRDSTAFAIIGEKGEPYGKLLSEQYKYDPIFAPAPGDTIILRETIEGTLNPVGSVTSEKIGPSSKWRSVHHRWNNLEDPSNDQFFLQVVGVEDSTGDEVILMDSIKTDSTDLSAIDPAKYKIIYLRAQLSDVKTLTPAQLGNWTVFYDPVPEGTLEIDSQFRFASDTITPGEKAYVKIKYRNISPYPMKPILVSTSITNGSGHVQGNAVKLKTYPALMPGAHFYVEDTISVPIGIEAVNLFAVFVNPEMNQPEVSLENNFIKFPFFIPSGHNNPVMDVTFDGRHLRYMDIVSTTPTIKVLALGDKAGLPLYDTSFYRITLTGPDNMNPQRVAFSSPELEYDWGTFEESRATVTFMPTLAPGLYTFTAQATDIKGQSSGTRPYSVTFRVIGESKASRIYMYPNPLTGTSRFVFILTGDEVPDRMTIQVFNLRGQMVNELSLNKGNPHIGYNELEWDGRSASGEYLPDGLYLYRVIMQKNGRDLSIHPVSDDDTLEKTYGKLQILRE